MSAPEQRVPEITPSHAQLMAAAVLSVSVLILAGCSTADADEQPSTVASPTSAEPTEVSAIDGEWLLASGSTVIDGGSLIDIAPFPLAPVTLDVSGQRATVSDGCGEFEITIDDTSVTQPVTNLPTDEPVCNSGFRQTATDVRNALAHTVSIERHGDVLVLAQENPDDIESAPDLEFVPLASEPLVRTWVLSSGSGPDGEIVVSPDAVPTLNVRGLTVTGSDGCNGFSGSVDLDTSDVSFSDMVSTAMACGDDGVMSQAATFMDALVETVSWEIDGDALHLSSPGSELVFEPEPTIDLAGTWELREVSTLDGQLDVIPTAVPTLTVADGEVSGSDGCNGFRGSVEVVGSRLLVDGIAMTERACGSDAILEVAEAYIDILTAAGSATVDDEFLVLRAPRGVLHFTRSS